ncbi:DNA (cytosine-5)-methyltransferase CMT2 isoform X3 [Hevea brasiliensis]|uniref:DNA (cytosine-5)-methyltransferase CMT2 isoform X3 n=1 Tax=Hevea brasiliensis TaxID=3981 RepID=UPI0025CF6FD1|nr:DNA (cytosine-5)-methyltransferase CMT2 isoform X3 [Hevea brasiliensis]
MEEKVLRRSPRLSSSVVGTESSCSKSKPTLQNHSSQLRASVELGAKPLLSWHGDDCCGLSDSLDEQPFKRVKTFSENSDLEMLEDDLLSPRITNSDFGVEKGKTKSSLIELPKSDGKHPPENKLGKLRSLEKIKHLCSEKKQNIICSLIGDPVPNDEVQERWRWRYEMKSQRSNSRRLILDDDDEDKIVWNVECHYTQAKIGGSIFDLGDCAYIKGEGEQKHVGKIVEFFKTTDGEDYFRVQWFYRAEDTVIKDEAAFHDKKRLFYSSVMNDNPIDCIISKVSVVQIPPMIGSKSRSTPPSGFYFDMEYNVDYSSFQTLQIDESFNIHNSLTRNAAEPFSKTSSNTSLENMANCESYKAELALLDLFSGCGGMSTGLCLGAKLACIDLVTRWALDSDKSACESLKLNHPETHVRNEAAEDFLELLKEWEKLCKKYVVKDVEGIYRLRSMTSTIANENENKSSPKDDDIPPGEYEVSRLVDICYGDPNETGKRGLKFKVHWKGYGTSEDTWEPIEGLSHCQECIRNFVRHGFKSKILPFPGDVDVICGGPPCQGISGYNRYRNVNSPLADERNRQIVVFMDIVQFLKPKFVLMENVVDILRFDKASFARYALSRLVHMKYQARLGTIAAGCYGLPQFRLRVFLWGAHASEQKLPQFPLPTHDVIVRYWPPPEFERNTVAYNEDQPHELEKASVLQDAISDLPYVTSHETREEITYEKPPETEFQRFIRSTKYEMTGLSREGTKKIKNLLYDHRPYTLNEDDYARVCQIPKRKGANFRDLPGIVVGGDNVVRRDPTKEQVLLPSGKPLVPDFAFTFVQGKSKRPYARLWWDETVSTVVTYPDLHSQAVIHPEQDRVLTIRECARLQGFPDYYRFSGTVKERYRQIGNAVAVPVGRALGYALGMAFQKLSGDEPLMELPPKFSHSTNLQLTKSLFHKTN